MNKITRFFAIAMLLTPITGVSAAPLTGTAGSNLTAFNGASGAMNNNQWNTMMNVRTGSNAAAADFGNCNALILRCAQPKCATGGCTTMEIAYPIVSGCVLANEACKSHGEALTQTIAAQLVANSTARANAAAAEAQAMASQAAAAASEQQLQQMQMQMQQMQQQMSQQSAQQTASLQAALEEQKQLAAAQAAEAARNAELAAAAAAAVAPTEQILNAAANGVSADVLARQQASGQILTKLENAEDALKSLKKTMQNVFDYAGCDASGDHCTGPKRVKAFKDKAEDFFEPYEAVLDEVYDALIMAQSLGVDITDIYMMLNGTCNVWGKYLCANGQTMHYTTNTCPKGMSTPYPGEGVRGGSKCTVGHVVPMNDGGCQLIQMLTNNEEVQMAWLYPEQNIDSRTNKVTSEVRVGCASEALDNSMLFRGRKKQATIDVETLQRIIGQDSPAVLGRGKTVNPDAIKFCAVNDDELYELQKLVSLKQLPSKVCVTEKFLADRDLTGLAEFQASNSSDKTLSANDKFWQAVAEKETEANKKKRETDYINECKAAGGSIDTSGICDCGYAKSYNTGSKKCEDIYIPTFNLLKR
ncbi:hypothetical protein LJC18_01975 [Lachnospiraceae bacterium OttesenSCG-928-E19]|nr:hypothetical protein [Lachnospiraceae bacterium OttesenSCG-928-E19]